MEPGEMQEISKRSGAKSCQKTRINVRIVQHLNSFLNRPQVIAALASDE